MGICLSLKRESVNSKWEIFVEARKVNKDRNWMDGLLV